jgi:hypothetical protein
MRLSIACLPVVIATAFLVGRATSLAPAVGASAAHVYTGRLNDVFRVPAAALRCEVSAEAGSVKVSCGHVPYAKARHDIVFYKDNTFVYRLGHPDTPVWSAKGRP